MNNPYFDERNEKELQVVRNYLDLPKMERGHFLSNALKPKPNINKTTAPNSVITNCLDCKISGINLPSNSQCGNCGSFNTYLQ